VEDLDSAALWVDEWVSTPLNQNQYDALCDFVYNVGPGIKGKRDGFVWLKSGQPSTMLRLLNAGDYTGAAMEFPKWNLPPLPGIIRRRATEQALFLRDDNLEPVT
jgi:lysozyme